MPTLGKRRIVGKQTREGHVQCDACGTQISALSEACPTCGAQRRADYKVEEITPGRVLAGADEAKAQAGAQECPYCHQLGWVVDDTGKDWHCKSCGGTRREAQPEPEYPDPVMIRPARLSSPPPRFYPPIPQKPTIPWRLIAIIGGGVVITGLLVFLLVGLFTTNDVKGTVTSVYWSRTAHVEEYQLLTGEDWSVPANGTQRAVATKWHHDQENIVGQATAEVHVTSTPEVDHYEYGTDILVTPPYKIGETEPEICSDPTPLPGGNVEYDMCSYDIMSDPVEVEVTSQPTPVYKDPVDVIQHTGPTPVFGTPTPVFRDWYTYSYWAWVWVYDLPKTEGWDNEPYWPTTQVDENHRVVNDKQYYRVEITFDNGYVKVVEGSDPAINAIYRDGMSVVGQFNRFGGLNSYTP